MSDTFIKKLLKIIVVKVILITFIFFLFFNVKGLPDNPPEKQQLVEQHILNNSGENND